MSRQKSIIDEPLTIIYPMGTYTLLHFLFSHLLYSYDRIFSRVLQQILCCAIGANKAHLSLLQEILMSEIRLFIRIPMRE